MPETLRLVHVLSSLEVGGAEINTVRLVRALERRGFKQVVVSMTPRIEQLLAAALPVPLISAPRARRWPISAAFLARVIRDHRAHVVHGRGYVNWRECATALMLARTPARLVQSFHGPGSFAGVWRQAAAAVLQRCTAACVAVSHDISRRLEAWNIASEKIHVIPNGIDLAAFRSPPDDAVRIAARRRCGLNPEGFVAGTVGSLAPVKNQELLIRAFALLVRAVPDSQLLLAGEGPRQRALAELAAQLQLAERVFFVPCAPVLQASGSTAAAVHATACTGRCASAAGSRPPVTGALASMDVFVQPSIREGSPTAVLEAMACGLPAIAADASGCAELHARAGVPLLVDPADPAQLAAVLIELAGQPQRCRDLGQQGRTFIEKHCNIRNMAETYERMYREMCVHSWTAPCAVGREAP